ncbi:hypothetical protein [Klebsiella pneumoniae]|uniref:hypothetical protein n=1 Tax=Klebsiella pneumoniae TaxID=573 RepID=UPI003AF34D11
MRRHSPVSLVGDEKRGSTITLQAVNELIQSLESAGELSIREQKFLKLAKAYQQLAAENVALKSFGDKLNDMHNALNGEGTGIQGRAEVACQQVALEAAMEEFDAIETPATDAVLTKLRNEAGARAVELFAKTLGSPYRFRDEQCYEDGFTRAIEIVRFAQAPLFARQLREGTDK